MSVVNNPNQDELWKAMAEKKQQTSCTGESVSTLNDNPEEESKDVNKVNKDESESENENDDESGDNDQRSSNLIVPATTLHETQLPSGEEEETILYKGRAKLYRFKQNADEKNKQLNLGKKPVCHLEVVLDSRS
jgi:hypothetical protein